MVETVRHIGSAYRIQEDRFGGTLNFDDAQVAVGTTQAEVAGGDPERVNMILINLSSQVMYVAPFPEVSATRGIALQGGGGSLSLNAHDDGILVAIPWYAIASLALQTMYRVVARRDTALQGEG